VAHLQAKPIVSKVVCYVIQDGHLLVFTHDEVPIEVAGVQVPAGSIEPGESPEAAAVREVLEETGLRTTVAEFLGRERYDISPARNEVAVRHFFRLTVDSPMETTARWTAGDPAPSAGGTWPPRWTCWWLPVENGHVLAAGLGARLGSMYP